MPQTHLEIVQTSVKNIIYFVATNMEIDPSAPCHIKHSLELQPLASITITVTSRCESQLVHVIWTWYDTFCKKVNVVCPCDCIMVCSNQSSNLDWNPFSFTYLFYIFCWRNDRKTCHKSCPSQRLYARKDVFLRGNSNVLLVSLLFVLICFY